MATIKRRRRKQRGEFTGAQMEILIYGCVMVSHREPGFTSEVEESAAWNKYRTTLMSEHSGSGRRPAAFYKFDLGMKTPPNSTFEEIDALRVHGVLSQEEIIAIEREHHVLNPAQAAVAFSAFDDGAKVPGLSHRMLRTFEIATHWHAWLGRPELEQLYRRRADMVRRAMESLSV